MIIYLDENMQPMSERELDSLQEASFSFLPRFKRDPRLKRYAREVEEAKQFLEMEMDEITPTTAQDVFALIFRFCEIYDGVGSLITFPLCFILIGLPLHLWNRLEAWAWRYGYEQMVISKGKKVVSRYNELIRREKNPKLKAKLEETRDKLKEGLYREYD
jgi:hypothetical protein